MRKNSIIKREYKERMTTVTPQELKDLGYPSNIDELIRECEGVSLIEETEEYYLIHDDYNEEDKVLQINKMSGFNEHYFEFFSNEIDKQAIYDFAKTLPSLLFMNLKKVYFVEQEEDLEGLEEESPNHTFSFDDTREPIGMAIYRDSTAFINLRKLKELAKEEAEEDQKLLGYTKGEKHILMNAIFTTLAHELFHLMQFNPLIEEIIPDGEEPAEEFCRHYA